MGKQIRPSRHRHDPRSKKGKRVAPQSKLSKTSEALLQMSPEAAKGALQKLRDGYHNPNGRGYGEAQKTASGCLEVQKAVNASNGYVQIAPPSTLTGGKNGTRRKFARADAQGVNRLVVKAHKSQADLDRLLFGGPDGEEYHASHLCHNRKCIEPEHICVEPKQDNERRKFCRELGPNIWTEHDGKRIEVPRKEDCHCGKTRSKKCIVPSEHRECTKGLL